MGRRGSGGGFRPAPRTRAPAPARPAAAPVPAPRSNGGVMTGIVSSVVEGLTWGAGISLGHRIVDFFAGPRTIQVSHGAPSQPAPAPLSDACNSHNRAFADCISHNGSDIGRCQIYVDMLNQCRHGGGSSSAGIAVATTIA